LTPSTPRAGRTSGQVVAAFGRHYLVAADGGEYVRCVPRGKQSVVACGDRVAVAHTARGEGVIEETAPRATLFLRAAPHRRKLIAANATQVAVICAGEPSLSDDLVVRVIVAAESQSIRTLLVLNKTDLAAPAAAARERLAPFARAGYPIVELSAKRDVATLRARLAGETTVLIGQSGMGKSTLVNALVPAADAATREISRFLDSGRHTTTATRLYRLDADSAIIDSPGVQEFGLAQLGAAEIEHGFPELRPLAGRCRFTDCRHRTEPGCAVRAAVDGGQIHPRRLELLHRILDAEGATRG
jgi:ribosome biogenesis GTPase